ncbi:MAG: creatininase family protein [Parcubacteria group bacterium]|jgi:creatinine amidohydrolase
MKTYLKDFEKMAKREIAYIPLGTLEWHGNHLPIETDYLVAVKLCEGLAKKKPGYILPPIYLGTDKHKFVKGQKFVGMDRHLGKKLPGNLYYLEPALFEKMLTGLVKNLIVHGFKRIYGIAAHTGGGQMAALARVAKKIPELKIINPWENISIDMQHAEENETSVFWACYPEEEKISRKMKIPLSDDCFRFYGRDVRRRASLKLGKKMLNEALRDCLEEIK